MLVRDRRTSFDSQDLRRRPIEERKGLLAKLLNWQQTSIVLNQV